MNSNFTQTEDRALTFHVSEGQTDESLKGYIKVEITCVHDIKCKLKC